MTSEEDSNLLQCVQFSNTLFPPFLFAHAARSQRRKSTAPSGEDGLPLGSAALSLSLLLSSDESGFCSPVCDGCSSVVAEEDG